MISRLITLILSFTPVVFFAAELSVIGWGVVTTPEPTVYDKKGNRVATLKGGELFNVLKSISANKAPAYYIEVNRGTKKQRCVLSGTDCKVFLELPESDNATTTTEIKQLQKLLADYYTTLTLRTKLYERAREQHLSASPTKRLRILKAELAQVPAKDRAYATAMEKAAGDAERLRYRDLRKELRYRTTGIQQEIQRLEAEVVAWEKSHPFDEQAVRQKPVWKRLTAQLREMESVLVILAGIQPAAD